MKLKIMASCALLALAACASNNTQVQPAPKTNYEVCEDKKKIIQL